jgi:microcystin-dependent protein
MALRNYSNTAPPLALTILLANSSGATTATVASTTGYPSPPFLLGLDRGQSTEEVCLCTATTTTTFTIVRAYDGTTLQTHQVGGTVEQTSAAIDFREANALVNTLTTLGDILIFGPTGNQRLPIGSNGSVLTADSTQTNGLAWESGSTATLAPIVPTGFIGMTASGSIPTGWLACNGAAVSRTSYANLWTALGTTGSAWGQGDGTTTFNVPDLRGCAPIGTGTGSGLTTRTLGTHYGEEGHVLVTAELAQHNHSATSATTAYDEGHDHQYTEITATQTGAAGYQEFVAASVFSGYTGIGAANIVATTTTTIQNTGSNSAHNNIQPSVGVTYIVKI